MKRKLFAVLCLLMVCCLLPVGSLAGLYRGDVVRITARSPVNVRSGPGADYGVLGVAMPNLFYRMLGEENGWYFIQLTTDKQGCVPVQYCVVETGLLWSPDGADEVKAYVRNTHSNSLNIRTKADLSSTSIGHMQPNEVYPYLGSENDWHRILYNDQFAYVSAKYTTIEGIEEIYTEPFAIIETIVFTETAVSSETGVINEFIGIDELAGAAETSIISGSIGTGGDSSSETAIISSSIGTGGDSSSETAIISGSIGTGDDSSSETGIISSILSTGSSVGNEANDISGTFESNEAEDTSPISLFK